MNINDTVKIINTNTVFDNKTGVIEEINEEKNKCTVLVDFIPEDNKKVRQDFSLDNVEYYNVDDDIDIEISENEKDDSSLKEFLVKNHFI